MRNIVLFLNLRTNKKLFLSNRKLAHSVYERICKEEKYPFLSYSRFHVKLLTVPIRFLDYEITYSPLYNPLATNLNTIHNYIVTSAPGTTVRAGMPEAEADNAVPIPLDTSTPDAPQPGSDNEQTAPAPES